MRTVLHYVHELSRSAIIGYVTLYNNQTDNKQYADITYTIVGDATSMALPI